MSFINYNKYDFDFYLQDGVLTTEQIEELRLLSNNENSLISKLQQFICDRELHQRYNNYFENKNVRGNIPLSNTGVDQKIIKEIQGEQIYHLNLLLASKIISENVKDRIQSFIDQAIFRKLTDVFGQAKMFLNRKKDFQNVKKRMEKGLAENILTAVPNNSNEVLSSFDFVKYFTHHKIFNPQDYKNEHASKNVIALLQDIISFLPNKENFGKVFTEIRDDGREIYYINHRDLMITINYNGKPISLRSHINFKYFEGHGKPDFNEKDKDWNFSQAPDIFNKIYANSEKDYRLYIIKDSPENYGHSYNNEDSRFAIVLGSQKLGQLPFTCNNTRDPNEFKFTEKEIDDLVDNMKNVGLFQNYSAEEIELGRHLGKTNFSYAPERIFWYFDYFVLAICPRENLGYQYFMDKIPHMMGKHKLALENWQEDIENGFLEITLNGKKYETNQLLKNQCDPFFILFINQALQDQGLGQFYKWENDFDPHEQFSVIYSSPEVMEKVLGGQNSLPRFSELEEENIKFWR
ncbi:MAG: hypothetical protein AB8H03_17000 [Saprospiraceae bacterium]